MVVVVTVSVVVVDDVRLSACLRRRSGSVEFGAAVVVSIRGSLTFSRTLTLTSRPMHFGFTTHAGNSRLACFVAVTSMISRTCTSHPRSLRATYTASIAASTSSSVSQCARKWKEACSNTADVVGVCVPVVVWVEVAVVVTVVRGSVQPQTVRS